jgi:aspartyl-tRNA(Asn)/glutamyl-tRNA(Gln) amidotransferase subunit C
MPDEITPELFNHLVHLAALELSEQEAEYLRHELNNQLRAVHELEAIPLEGDTSITSHGVPYTPERTPAIRKDVWVACSNPDEILAQAPELDEGYLIVPEIPHTELK